MVSKGKFVGLDWSRITRLHSQVKLSLIFILKTYNRVMLIGYGNGNGQKKKPVGLISKKKRFAQNVTPD